jgi:Na+/H+-dicarboxylate symporter
MCWNFFRNFTLPFQLLTVIAFVLVVGPYLSSETAQILYTFSLVFKELLGAILPLIIFSFILAGILSFKKNAPIVVAILIISIIASNFIVSISSFSLGRLFLPFLTGTSYQEIANTITIEPLFQFSIPSYVSSEKAMLSALLIGIGLSFIQIPYVEKSAHFLKTIVERILNYLFIPFLPFYVLGFLLKITHEGTFQTIFESYGKTFGLIFIIQILYLFLMYFFVSGASWEKTKTYIRNVIPSYLTAFSTMSSTAAIPVTINCATKNTGNRPLAQAATPILANVHLTGDGITVPIIATVTMSLFTGTIPGIFVALKFISYFCMVMLATSGVPGGGIIVVIPLLKSILGFSPEMVSIITALYLLQDSFGTAGNVTGDGALIIFVHKILKRLKIIKP